MPNDSSVETTRNAESTEVIFPTPEARAAVHELLGLPGNSIENPSEAKSFLRLDDFWKTVPKDLSIPADREIFLGFDYDEGSGQLTCTENTMGSANFHEPKSNHLVMLHTEPANTPDSMSLKLGPVHLLKPTKTEVFSDNFPTPYTGDMHFMLNDLSVYAEIIIRLGLNDDLPAVMVAIRTNQFKNAYKQLFKYELKNFALDQKHPLSQKLGQDKIITQEGGIAIYRGFTHLPPEHDDVLRLRKFN